MLNTLESLKMTARNWVFTLNNPERQLVWESDDNIIKYAVWQLERGEQGTPHYQGMIVTSSPTRLAGLKKFNSGMLARAHFEKMRGTIDEAEAYAMKSETRAEGPWKYGSKPAGKGSRSDLTDIKNILTTSGRSGLKRVADEHFGDFLRYHKGIDAFLGLHDSGRNPNDEIKVNAGFQTAV